MMLGKQPTPADSESPETKGPDSKGQEPKRWDERVRLRAYYLWEAEGRPLGRNDEFWDRAHRQIIAESVGETAAPSNGASGIAKPPAR